MNTGAWSAFLILAFAGTAHSQGTLSEYTTYISSASASHVARVRTDASGNTFVAGNRSGGALSEMFVEKLDSTGQVTSFLGFGGNGTDTVADMALDAAGNVYLAGSTSSTSFPLVQPLQSAQGPGFIVKLDLRTNSMLYATYFPAAVSAIAVDSAGNMYVTGWTTSSSFPVTAGLPAGLAGGGVPMVAAAFITKILAAGDRIVYSTRISGQSKPCGCCSSCFLSSRFTAGNSIAVDPAGNTYVAGNTDTTDIPTTAGAFLQNGIGAFVAKVNAAGTSLSYLTYIGAANYVLSPNNAPGNGATALTVDSSGSVYLAGATSDPAFPATAGAYQTAFAGPVLNQPYPPPPSDAFVLKLKPDGSGLVWATYLGGTGVDSATSLALDPAGNPWIAGTTASPDFPNQQGWSSGTDFLAGFNATGSALTYSARYPAGTVSQSLAVDASGLLHVAGGAGVVSTIAPSSTPEARIFGIANAAYGPVGGQMARGELISIYGPHIGPSTPLSYTPTPAGFVPTTLGGVQVLMGPIALPLLYVSDSQINAVAPFSLYGSQSGFTLQLTANGAATPLFSFASIDADPEIFQNADRTAAAVNEDGTLNSADHPAKVGSVVSIWITGVGTTSAYLPDGQIATGALPFACCTVYAGEPQATAEILYSGSAPGAVAGVVQINFRLPANAEGLPAGVFPVNVVVAVGGQSSNPAIIYEVN